MPMSVMIVVDDLAHRIEVTEEISFGLCEERMLDKLVERAIARVKAAMVVA